MTDPTVVATQENIESPAGDRTPYRTVLNTIWRPDLELDVRPLYLTGVSFTGGGGTGQSGQFEENDERAPARADQASGQSSRSREGVRSTAKLHADGTAEVEAGERVSFGTYFNAFPASYWRRWTEIPAVRLTVRLHGAGSLVVYRSTSRGDVIRAASVQVESTEAVTETVDLSLKPFIDGGWYWFDLEAGEESLVLEQAHWSVPTDRPASGTASIGITTFNRPDFCVAQLKNLARTPQIMDVVDRIFVVDQGTQKVVDEDDYPAVQEALGDRLEIIEQPNLGGSGGFSRAMHETAARSESDYVLLLDDDVVCELEGIRRAITFADLCKDTTLVGGHMFSLYNRSVLHAMGEALAQYRWFWGPVPGTPRSLDFSEDSLRSTRWLHRRVDVDYNGWWMCLIPTEVVRKIGLSMPMFIKWDDAEFGLRAKEAGFPTVSLPGAAVWHVPWTEKDDTIDWQAYFHERNRLTSALLHSPYPHGGSLIRESAQVHMKHCVSMQYSAAEMLLMAIEDVLDGPHRMHRDMAHRLGELRELRKGYADSQAAPDLDRFPTPRRSKPPRKGRSEAIPKSMAGYAKTFAVGLARQLTPVRELSVSHPETVIPAADQRWWRFIQYDSAVVSSADGGAAAWYRRDPKEFRRQVERSAKLHARLYREWPELVRTYRDALDQVTSPEAWEPTFRGEA